MIPYHISDNLLQYKGHLTTMSPNLDTVQRIKITDSVSKAILFNSEVKLIEKKDWSSSQEYYYFFEKIDNIEEDYSVVFFVTDKLTGKIKTMSLEKQIPSYNTYLQRSLRIEYKADSNVPRLGDSEYELEFEHRSHKPHEEFTTDDIDERFPKRFMQEFGYYG